MQRPKKSELSGWQNSTRKNFPDEVRKSFFATNKVRKSFCGKKVHKIAIWSPSQKGMCCFCNIITILWWHNHTSLMHKLQTFGIIKDFLDHQKLSRLSRNFPDYPETFQIIRKLSRLSRNFPDHPDTFQIIRKPSRLSRNFLGFLETKCLWNWNHSPNLQCEYMHTLVSNWIGFVSFMVHKTIPALIANIV